jgi:hemerythrin-like domain-containing protein
MKKGEFARHEALRLVRDEHRSLSAVVHAVLFIAKKIEKGATPDLALLGAIVHYLTQFPERLHHPAEDRYLFEPLRRKTTESGDVLDTLELEHRGGEERSARLTAAVNQLAAKMPGAQAAFLAEVERYAHFYWDHVVREETLVLPLAERMLDEQDWAAAAEGFRANHDPMYGGDTANEFEVLFRRIVFLAPAPIGLGGGGG